MTDHTHTNPDEPWVRRHQELDDGCSALVDVDPVFAVVCLDERMHDSVPQLMRGFLHWNGVEVVFVPYSDHSLEVSLNEGWVFRAEGDARQKLHEQLLDELLDEVSLHDPHRLGARAGLFAAMAVLHEMVDEADAKLTANLTLGNAHPESIGDFVFSIVAMEVMLRLLLARCGVDRSEALLRFVHDAIRDIDHQSMYRELLDVPAEGAR